MLKVEDNKEPTDRNIHLDDIWNFENILFLSLSLSSLSNSHYF